MTESLPERCCCGGRYAEHGGASTLYCPMGQRALCEECASEGGQIQEFLGEGLVEECRRYREALQRVQRHKPIVFPVRGTVGIVGDCLVLHDEAADCLVSILALEEDVDGCAGRAARVTPSA